MKNKELVKIRKEKNYYLSYFVELRKIIIVNEIGAKIIDLFFNRNYSLSKIVDIIFVFKKKNNKDLEKKVKQFLIEIEGELKNKHQGGYPFIKEEQMDIPIAVELQINSTCNLRCKHCCQSSYDKLISFKKIEKILEILAEEKVFEINLVGGELFLHPDVLKIISLCCEKYNFAINIITNATLLSERLIKKISKFKDNIAFLVSLEGVGDYNDEIRGKGTFEKINKTIKNLKKYGIYLEISSTINAVNIKHWRKTVAYCKELNIPCNFNLFKVFKPEQESLVLKPCDYFDFVKKIFEIRKKEKINIGLTNASIVAEINKGKPRNECRATLSGLNINVKQEMVPCSFLDDVGYYKNKKLPIFDKNFKDKWKNNYWFKKFRKGNLKECQACSYIFSGDINKVNPYSLTAFKRYLKNNKKYE